MKIRMKKIVLWLIALCIIVAFLGRFINHYCMMKNLMEKNLSIIWAQGEALDPNNKHVMTTMLYRQELGKTKELLEDRYSFRDFISNKDHTKLLSLIGNKKVAEYDIATRELKDIVNIDQLDVFLKEKGYREEHYNDAWLHCPRYYDHENKITVLYGKFIIGCSSQEGLELLYILKTADKGYSWADNDSTLLIQQYDGRLGYCDLKTHERKDLMQKVKTISPVAENNTFVLRKSKGGGTWLFDLEHKSFQKVCGNGFGDPEYQISADGQYLLWKDNIPVMMQEFDILYVVDLKSGKKIQFKTWGFDTPVYGMTWNWT